MCYSNCPNERASGMCSLRHPQCESEPEDTLADILDDYADRLYNEYKDGDITESQARSRYKKAFKKSTL